MTNYVTGDRRLNRALAAMGRKSGTIARAGVRAGLKDISKAIKSEVPPRIRAAISHRLKKNKRTGRYDGKAGGGVGKRNKGRQRGKRPGVGFTKQNVHWYLLGTNVRRQTTTGRMVGRMPPNNAVRRGTAKARPGLKSTMRRVMWARIKQQARKGK